MGESLVCSKNSKEAGMVRLKWIWTGLQEIREKTRGIGNRYRTLQVVVRALDLNLNFIRNQQRVGSRRTT